MATILTTAKYQKYQAQSLKKYEVSTKAMK